MGEFRQVCISWRPQPPSLGPSSLPAGSSSPSSVHPPPCAQPRHPFFGEEEAKWWEKKMNTKTKQVTYEGKLKSSRALSKFLLLQNCFVCTFEERPGVRTDLHFLCDFPTQLKTEPQRVHSEIAACPAVVGHRCSERWESAGGQTPGRRAPDTPVCKTFKTVRGGQ